MKISEEQLYRAAKLADAIDLATLPDEAHCPKHEFSPEFEARMQKLIQQVENGEIPQAKAFMGYSYYAQRGAAAVLIAFLLTCVTMPETVIAGYHKLMDVIENVVTEYTEYKYHSRVPGTAVFTPLQFGYLPEGMKAVEWYEDENELKVTYNTNEHYFILRQQLVTENSTLNFVIDTEDAFVKSDLLRGITVTYIYKDDVITYAWTYDKYHISGKCNLSTEELEKILNNLIIR